MSWWIWNGLSRAFIFTDRGLTTLDKLPRNEEALSHGGQVYVPKGINHEGVGPHVTSVSRSDRLPPFRIRTSVG